MNAKRLEKWARVVGAGGVVVAGGLLMAPGCLDRPIAPVEPRTTSTIVERLTQSAVDKIDLLIAIDNSGSMADKQDVFKQAVPDLVKQLVNPRCIDDTTGMPGGTQPADPLSPCDAGFKREFDPILDIHVGVISSSLGSHGSDQCTGTGTNDPSQIDMAHLLTRGVMLDETYQSKGFLVWDPDTKSPSHSPQGLTDINQLIGRLEAIVVGVGEKGCGYEAQFESWYRFLVEPDPYKTIEVVDNKAFLKDTDEVVVEQRRAFLRPDSLLAIIILTDENDCSIRDYVAGQEGTQFFFVAQSNQNKFRMPKARLACATNPNDPCCRSCGQPPAEGCDWSQDDCCVAPCGDPTCKAMECQGVKKLTEEFDDINHRCWDQKRRFGIDFLWPFDRYVKGLQLPEVQDRFGNSVPNPLYYDLCPDTAQPAAGCSANDKNATVRDPGLVFLAGIVGVPWQDIARRDGNGKPDLLGGLDIEGKPVGGLQTADELAVNKTWELILGDPSCYHTDPAKCLPADPLMIETPDPRTGTNPITGDALAGPGSNYYQNPINGHEWDVIAGDDLQYACIFKLPTPRDCTGTNANCDCKKGEEPEKNPLCQDQTNAFGNTQYSAKAYPGIRHLQLLKGLGKQGIVASACPAQLDDQNAPTYGYRPAIGAIIDRLKKALGGKCLPRTLTPDSQGQVQCLILEARVADPCTCNTQGRKPEPLGDGNPAVKAAKGDPLFQTANWNCFCEIQQLQGKDLEACQQSKEEPTNVHGWCYVDATTVPPVGNPDIVAKCPSTEKRIVRFVGEGQGETGATLFITCSGD
jgi:hypothetical protein